MSTGQTPSPPSTQFQVDAYPGADTAILGSAAVTADFWNYYSTWATAYAAYWGVQLEVTNYVYNPSAIDRTIDQPGYWENWVSTLGTGVVRRPAGTTLPPPPPPAPVTPPTTTNWTLVAVSGLAATSVVVLFLLALKHGGRAAAPVANPTIQWYPSSGGTGWIGDGIRGTFLLRRQPNNRWAVHHLATKYGPFTTLDDAKYFAAFMNAHPSSALPRSGKGVLYVSPKRFYRTERIEPPIPKTRFRVHMASGRVVVVSAVSPEAAMMRVVGKSSASVNDPPVYAESILEL